MSKPMRPGGASYIVMQGPDGTQMPNRGVYLEVIPNRKIVFTDAYTSAWVPSRQTVLHRHHHLRGRRRQDALHGACAALDRRGQRRS